MLVGRTGVTVRNGTVRAFDVGVVIEGGSGNTVESVTAFENTSFSETTNRGGDGIAILSSSNNRILRNNTVNNGPFSGIGVYSDVDSAHPRATFGVSTDNLIDGNVVEGNIQGRTPNNVVNNDNIGIRLEPGNVKTVVVNNRVNNNGLDGITLRAQHLYDGPEQHRDQQRLLPADGTPRQRDRPADRRRPRQPHREQPGRLQRRQRDRDPQRLDGEHGAQQHRRPERPDPPVSDRFGPIFDLLDNNANCDSNTWRDNRYGTAFPACAADTP